MGYRQSRSIIQTEKKMKKSYLLATKVLHLSTSRHEGNIDKLIPIVTIRIAVFGGIPENMEV